MTPCLRRLSTDEIVQTSVKRINRTPAVLDTWLFDWSQEIEQGSRVYALYANGDDRIQGLLSVGEQAADGGLFVNLLESAPFNRKPIDEGKEYGGVGAHLFAEAIRQSRKNRPDGYIYFIAKSDLIEYYQKAMGAVLTNPRNRYMAIFDDAADTLLHRYYGE